MPEASHLHFNYLLDNGLFLGVSAFRLARVDGVSGRAQE